MPWNKQLFLTIAGTLTLIAGLIAFFYFEGLASKPIYLFAIITITVIVLAVILVYIYLLSKGKIQQTGPDYRILFYLGLMFFIFGSLENITFYVIGLIFVIVGLANRKKWKPELKWIEMPPAQRNLTIAAIVILFFLLIGGFVMWYLGAQNKNKNFDGEYTGQVTNFEECVAVGNSVMESYPRQCRHEETTYVEDVKTLGEPTMTQEEAFRIAQEAKECSRAGILSDNISHNPNSKTWWIDLDRMPELEKDGCNPACVVSEQTKTAEVNWRCTGLKEPEVIACALEQRNADFCTTDYTPVCAKVNVQCITTPCNPVSETFPNACEACKNSLVESYIAGECK